MHFLRQANAHSFSSGDECDDTELMGMPKDFRHTTSCVNRRNDAING